MEFVSDFSLSWLLACLITFLGTIVILFVLPKRRVSNFHERYVLITGCDSGFGKQTALRLDELGFHVFATCLTDEGEENLKSEASERLQTLHLDVTSSQEVRRTYEIVEAKIPRGKGLWGLVNNAGIFIAGPIEWQPLSNFRTTADVNLWGMIDVTKTFLPLVKRAGGRVVNFSSLAGRLSTVFAASYSITKYGIEAFSDALRREIKPWGVRVSMIEPGMFRTPIMNRENFRNQWQRQWDELSDELKQDYGDSFLQAGKRQFDQYTDYVSTKTHLVVEAVVDALSAHCPQTRYVVGLDAWLMWLPLTKLPTCLTDFILSILGPLPSPQRNITH